MDRWLLVTLWILLPGSVLLLVPRRKLRTFIMACFATHILVWIKVTLLVHFKIVTFPLREFPIASDLSFTMPNVVYPVLTGYYILWKPERMRMAGIVTLVVCSGIFASLHLLLDSFTRLIDLTARYYWFADWVSFIVILFAVNRFMSWFQAK
ncbi:CBO0543 family protein [Paenibacillus sambharensis]|nr:CBO0543 family protein [Paenibacillus sambharensis]